MAGFSLFQPMGDFNNQLFKGSFRALDQILSDCLVPVSLLATFQVRKLLMQLTVIKRSEHRLQCVRHTDSRCLLVRCNGLAQGRKGSAVVIDHIAEKARQEQAVSVHI